jgi:hypothetical protein
MHLAPIVGSQNPCTGTQKNIDENTAAMPYAAVKMKIARVAIRKRGCGKRRRYRRSRDNFIVVRDTT